MTDRPLIMSAPMMRAYLSGRKTVTRRLRGLEKINANPDDWSYVGDTEDGLHRFDDGKRVVVIVKCPFGSPGDELWFREAWLETSCDCISSEGRRLEGCQLCHGDRREDVRYMADYEKDLASSAKWRPSIHMPRWASRAVVEILSIRAERIQDITEEEARKEGVDWASPQFIDPRYELDDREDPREVGYPLAGASFAIPNFIRFWNSLHGPDAWERNDYVWRIEWPRYEEGK